MIMTNVYKPSSIDAIIHHGKHRTREVRLYEILYDIAYGATSYGCHKAPLMEVHKWDSYNRVWAPQKREVITSIDDIISLVAEYYKHNARPFGTTHRLIVDNTIISEDDLTYLMKHQWMVDRIIGKLE